MPPCDCRYAEISEHEPHQAMFCSAPIVITDPEMAAILRRPPKPLKILIDVKVERE